MKKYEAHTIEKQEIPFLFMNTFHCNSNHSCCICNWHENVEILFITEGSGIVRIEDSELPVKKGEIAIINANQIHDIYTKEDMRYACLIIDRTFFIQNGVDSNELHFRSVIRDDSLYALLKEFEAEFLTEESTPYRTQALRSLVLRIILIICRNYSEKEPLSKTDKKIHATIMHIIGLIRRESHTDISLDKIAKEEGWNKSYLAREFNRYTGQSMISFLNSVRCERAKTLLKESNLNIGETGRACGFNDQTYFTRTFRAHTGKTPGEYRKSHKQNNR